VRARHARLVALAVHLHVLAVALRQRLHGLFNVLHAAVGAHRFRADVGVQARAVPVARDRLGREGDLGAELFRHAVEEEAGHPHVVAHCRSISAGAFPSVFGVGLTFNAGARADLVLPLRGHDLGVGAGDVDVGVQASLVMRLDDIAAEDLAGAVAAVVGSLRGREAVPGPAVRPARRVEQRVLLLQPEPKLLRGVLLHQHGSVVAEVVGVGLAVRHPRLAQDEDVVAEAEGVRVHGDGAEVDVGVVARRLAGRGAVKVPFGQLLDVGGFASEGLRLG